VRAARLHELAGTPVVDEIDAPGEPDAVAVSTAALNPIDISIAHGRFYGGTPELPYVVGCEAVGENPAGERVWLYGRNRLLAERALPPEWCFPVPDGVSDELALACGVSGLTAWLALTWRVRVEPHDTVLVLGASGTLGATALQAAKLLGARRVIGAARRTANIPDCADEVVDLAHDAEFPAASLIVDALWGEPLERALAAAPVGVRVVHLGQSAGPAATLLSAWVRGKVASIFGHTLHAAPVEVARRGYGELCAHAASGSIAFRVERYRLAELADAWQAQASGSPGAKIVVGLG
jgi:NADPH:quinone reductase-like Zn-dependent oxidoreductase